jgi:hypothetical protein
MTKRALALIAGVLAAILVALGFAIPSNAETTADQKTQAAAQALSVPLTGDFTDALGGTGTFEGTFVPTRFLSQDGDLAVAGTVTGTLTDSAGGVVGTVSEAATLPAGIAQATCEILSLDLGPLDLDLLGLVVHLDEVVLDITAESGPGRLLGNLLCAIANLLNPNQQPGLLALLNRILGILG